MEPKSPHELLLHVEGIEKLASILLGTSHDAQDLAQETYLVALETNPQRIREPGAWMRGVARTLHKSHRRRVATRSHEPLSPELVSHALDPKALAERADGVKLIVRELADLQEPYQFVIRARYLQGRSLGEIAELTGATPSAVKQQLRRGLQKLRHRAAELEEAQRRDRRRLLLALLKAPLRSSSGWFLLAAIGLVGALLVGIAMLFYEPHETLDARRISSDELGGSSHNQSGDSGPALRGHSVVGPLETESASEVWASKRPRSKVLAGRLLNQDGSPLAHVELVARRLEASMGWVGLTSTQAMPRGVLPSTNPRVRPSGGDAASALPPRAEDPDVHPHDVQLPTEWKTTTNAEGEFNFKELPEGSFDLELTSEVYGLESSGSTVHLDPSTMTIPSSSFGYVSGRNDYVLHAKRKRRISIRVEDVRSADLLPVAGLQYSIRAGSWVSPPTDVEVKFGSAVLSWIPNRMEDSFVSTLSFRASSPGCFSETSSVRMNPDDESRAVVLRLERHDERNACELTLRVRTARGEPCRVPVEVLVSSSDGNGVRESLDIILGNEPGISRLVLRQGLHELVVRTTLSLGGPYERSERVDLRTHRKAHDVVLPSFGTLEIRSPSVRNANVGTLVELRAADRFRTQFVVTHEPVVYAVPVGRIDVSEKALTLNGTSALWVTTEADKRDVVVNEMGMTRILVGQQEKESAK